MMPLCTVTAADIISSHMGDHHLIAESFADAVNCGSVLREALVCRDKTILALASRISVMGRAMEDASNTLRGGPTVADAKKDLALRIHDAANILDKALAVEAVVE